MNKFPLLIEIGCEDLPPDAMAMIEATAESNFSRLLKEKRIAHGKVTGFVTPRRIAVLAEGVGSKQDPVREKIKGPPRAIAEKNGVPTKAGLGFAQKVGVEYGELQIEKTPRGDYLSCIRQIEGENIRDIMSDILESFVTSFHFPITMRWPGGGVRFPRPIRWFIVRLGAKNVSCSLGQMKNARSTRGHYLFADKNIVIKDIAEYEQVLKQNYVLADPRKRREYLRKSIDRALKYTAGQPVITEELLGEVSSLLEYPTGIRGEFSEKYLKLPREVIEACLMYHQKYFPVEDEKGNLMNYFVGVRDGISEHLKSIKKGYEKVLIARLEDAEFFLKQDRCHPLEYYSEQLAGIEFTRGLGTLIDKVQRCNVTAAGFSRQLDKNDDFINTVQRISKLGKADLVTRMVGEFPELEGKVGRIYAKMDGEGNKVSNGIYQHYMPRTFEDNVPKIDEAAMVGVADRMDTLVGNYGAGVEATGSQDPFGMRRACRGLIRILVEKKWDLDLEELAKNSREQYKKQTDIEFSDDKMEKLGDFLGIQVRNYLEETFVHDIARCVMAPGELRPYILSAKAAAVRDIKKSRGFGSLVAAFKRINNILRQSADKNIEIPGEVDMSALKDESEIKLGKVYSGLSEDIKGKLKEDDYKAVLKTLSSIRDDVDSFFEKVLVMDPDENVMKNRLALLKNIVELFAPVGDISSLEMK